jgi:hypothetical protein
MSTKQIPEVNLSEDKILNRRRQVRDPDLACMKLVTVMSGVGRR